MFLLFFHGLKNYLYKTIIEHDYFQTPLFMRRVHLKIQKAISNTLFNMNLGFLKAALFLACPSLIQAACTLHNQMDEPETQQDDRDALCQPTGDDTWTFALRTSEVVVPTFDSDNMWAGKAGTKNFIVYDNNCVPQGVYAPEGNDCGIPYVIDDIEKLPYVITVKSVNFAAAKSDAYFRIAYANGDYMIRENQAVCHDMNSGLRVEVGCRAAFPINGEPE